MDVECLSAVKALHGEVVDSCPLNTLVCSCEPHETMDFG